MQKNHKNMWFSWDILQSMLENDDSKLQSKFGVHITSNIFKIIQFKNYGIAPTPLPTLKAYPTLGEGGRFKFFSLKWWERMNLKVPGAIYPSAASFWAPVQKLFEGLLQSP